MQGVRGRVVTALRNRSGAVSWRHPVVQKALPMVDLLERPVLRRRGLAHLPPYSIRVRSVGMPGQFGGRMFAKNGAVIVEQLRTVGGLTPDERVLDLGCGAAQAAFGLIGYLKPGAYTGLDIDLPQIEASRQNSLLTDAGCTFVHIDVENDLYNPVAAESAAIISLPFADDSFDMVFLLSVFTHMLPDEMKRYAQEILRILRPSGRALVSTFKKDGASDGQLLGAAGATMRFAHELAPGVWVEHPDNPRKAVSLELDTLDGWFGRDAESVILGSWRGCDAHNYQDLVVYRKPGTAP